MTESTPIVAFDQHAASVVAAADAGSSGRRRCIRWRPISRRFDGSWSGWRCRPVRCCYEAGPCGFELQRSLQAQGIECEVIAPALIPRRAGSRVKRIGGMPRSLRCYTARAR